MECHPNSHLPPNSSWDKVNSLLLSFKPKLLQLPAILCVSLHIALHHIGCLVVGFSLPKGPAWKNTGVVAVSYWCCKQQVSLQCYLYRLFRTYCSYTLSFWLSGHHWLQTGFKISSFRIFILLSRYLSQTERILDILWAFLIKQYIMLDIQHTLVLIVKYHMTDRL